MLTPESIIPEICRFCLSKEHKQLIVASEILDSSLTIEMVELFTGIQLNTANNIPYAICVDCRNLLNEWSEFRSSCLSNDIIFQQSYSTHILALNNKTDDNENQPQLYDTNGLKVEIMLPHGEETENYYDSNETSNNLLASDDESERANVKLFEVNEKQQRICSSVTKENLFANSNQFSSQLEDANSSCMHSNVEQTESQQIPDKTDKSPSDRKQQLCVVCGKLVKNLWYHVRTHAQDTTAHACPHCSMKMKNQSNLVRHIQAVHMKKVVKSCEPCGRGFSHINSYKAHMRSRHGVGETYQCQICLKTFKQPSGYKKHISHAHNNDRNFVCSICDKPFKDKQALNLHKNVHSTERRYACSMCPKQFKGASAKRTHELTHVGVVFKCTCCDKSYQYKSLLNIHVKKNHPERAKAGCKY